MQRVIVLLALLVAIVVGCEGKEGPMGPKGDKGDPGETGTSGVIIGRFFSTSPVPTNQPYCFQIPGLSADEDEIVGLTVYARQPEFDIWFELPLYFEDDPNDGRSYYFWDDEVCVTGCSGLMLAFFIVDYQDN